jgi:hypothetical protein
MNTSQAALKISSVPPPSTATVPSSGRSGYRPRVCPPDPSLHPHFEKDSPCLCTTPDSRLVESWGDKDQGLGSLRLAEPEILMMRKGSQFQLIVE